MAEKITVTIEKKVMDIEFVKGGFQLQDLIITELKSHKTCYNSIPLIGWNYSIKTREEIL